MGKENFEKGNSSTDVVVESDWGCFGSFNSNFFKERGVWSRLRLISGAAEVSIGKSNNEVKSAL